MLENNYLDFPLKYERKLMLNIYREALDLSDEENEDEYYNIFHHYDTMEDYIIPESKEKNKKETNKKIKRRKNPRVTKLLQGEDLIFETEKQYESDNCCENDFQKKIDKKNKSHESGEDTLFENKILPNNENKKKYLKKEMDKKAEKKEKKEEKENSEEFEEEEDSMTEITNEEYIKQLTEAIKIIWVV